MKKVLALILLSLSLNSFAYITDVVDKWGFFDVKDYSRIYVYSVAESLEVAQYQVDSLEIDLVKEGLSLVDEKSYVLYRDSLVKALKAAIPIFEWGSNNLTKPREKELARRMTNHLKSELDYIISGNMSFMEEPNTPALMAISWWYKNGSKSVFFNVGIPSRFFDVQNDPLFFESVVVHELTHDFFVHNFGAFDSVNDCLETEKSAFEVEGFYSKLATQYFKRPMGSHQDWTKIAIDFYDMSESKRNEWTKNYCIQAHGAR